MHKFNIIYLTSQGQGVNQNNRAKKRSINLNHYSV